MGTYASVRGWLECDARQLAAIRELITAHPAGYEAGWAFRSRHFNWTCYVFYGGDIREHELDWFGAQLHAMAALPAGDEDGDRVVGMFLVSAEERPPAQWHVAGGTVHVLPADPRLGHLGA